MLGKFLQRKSRSRLALGCLVLSVFVCLGSVLLADAALRSYPADQELLRAAYADPKVTVTQQSAYFKVEPAKTEAQVGMVFYPGGLVSPESYLDPLVKLVNSARSQGINVRVYLVRPPLNLSVLDYTAAEKIISEDSQVENWVVGGHSLGGAMACRYTAGTSEGAAGAKVKGLFLLAAYCDTDISASAKKVISIYGSNDQVLNLDLLEQYSKNLPSSSRKKIITGMNHAQFGAYGVQRGDGPAQVSLQIAQENWIAEINNWLAEVFASENLEAQND
jgi:dienelactone hydrolase